MRRGPAICLALAGAAVAAIPIVLLTLRGTPGTAGGSPPDPTGALPVAEVGALHDGAAVARRKLRQLEIAGVLGDLRVPPGNRLEALRGDRVGQYSIRINDRYRVCFRWTAAGPAEVEIVDYH